MALPTGPEQLRLRLTVMYNALAVIKLKHPGRNELADISADLFEKYKDYLLGDYVYGLWSAESAGAMILLWTLVLGYEHAIRKFANRLVSQEGYKLGEALRKAWKDATIKEKHFISPLSLYGKRTAEPPPVPSAGAERPGKGGKKGGGLCSPGRWPPDRRSLADGDGWSWLRNKLFEKAARRVGSVEELERGLPHGGWRRRWLPASQGPALHRGSGRYLAALAVIIEDEEKDEAADPRRYPWGEGQPPDNFLCRDKLRAPGAREKKQLVLEAMDRKEIPFSIVGDIKKAHRRFKHLAKEQGFLACQLDAREGPVGQLDNSCVYITLWAPLA